MSDTMQAERQSSTVAALQQRVRDLEACLGLNDRHLGSIFKLSSSLTNLLGLLMSVPNVTPDMISTRLRIATDPKVAIHRLRAELDDWATRNKKAPLVIHSKRSLGYWLDDDTKTRIKEVTYGVTPDEEIE